LPAKRLRRLPSNRRHGCRWPGGSGPYPPRQPAEHRRRHPAVRGWANCRMDIASRGRQGRRPDAALPDARFGRAGRNRNLPGKPRVTPAMKRIDAPPHDQEARLRSAWAAPKGWRYFSAVNNSEVGVWYLTGTFAFLLFGGVLALLIRAQLAVPENDLLSPDAYNQVFTLHGSVMMFLFAVPLFEAFAILLLPQLVASRDLPFPRLSAFGFYCFMIGGVFVCGSIFFDAAPRGGWFMYPPLTTAIQTDVGADIWLLGLSFIEIASIAAAVELIVGVLKCRAPGMRLSLMPLFCWYVLVVGIMILLAFPPLIAG